MWFTIHSEWSEWNETTVLITIDLSKDRITIYSKETQVYDIAKNEDESYDNDGDMTLSLYCVDKAGLTCRIRLVKLISQNDRNQLYVDYDDLKWVYNVYLLDWKTTVNSTYPTVAVQLSNEFFEHRIKFGIV